MSTKIRTNQLDYSLNVEEIRNRYDIFAVKTSEKYIKGGSYILDAVSLNNDIKAIRFESGKCAYLLMLHDENNKAKLKKTIASVEEGEKLFIEDVNVMELPDSFVLQLLLNALSSYDSELLKFNNLTGHLYCFHPEWIKHGKDKNKDVIWRIPCLDVRVTTDCTLTMDVHTFSSVLLKKKITFKKRKFEEYPQYIFSARNTLRRKLADDTEAGYIMRQIDGGKTEIGFLDLKNSKKFAASKVGMLSGIVSTFNDKYEGIAHIDFKKIEVTKQIDYTRNAAKENVEIIAERLGNRSIHIVDLIGDSYSEMYCNNISELIRTKYGVEVSVGKRTKREALNICVIHNAEYYNGINDPHDRDYGNIAVQHITFEDFSDSSEFAISTVIHELLIKQDIVDGKISLFNWEKLGFTEDISFGMAEEIEEYKRYFFMTIHADGTFEISECELNLFEINEYSDCVEIFEDAKMKAENIKGIIRTSNGEINIIKDTGLITLPEMEEIEKLLSQGDNKLRGKERRESLLSSCLDIKLYKENDAEYYFVGTIGEGMRWNIHRAANIRRIEGYGDARVMFEELLGLMNVTFVHNGQLTVSPFPFKYLREYINGLKVFR